MKKLIAVAGVLISVVALYWALRDINFPAVWEAIQSISPLLFLAAVPLWFFTIWGKVARWRLLFYPDHERISQGRLFSAMMIGYLFNTILPLRTGEVVRATVLRATAAQPVARTLSTILVEKVLDTMALVAGLGLILPFITLPEAFRQPSIIAAILFGGLFVVVLAAAIWPDVARALRDRVLPLMPAPLRLPIHNLSEQVLGGLIPLRRREVAPRIVLWTIQTWLFNIITTWVLLFSFNQILSIVAPALVVIATNLVMTIPSAPGYIGVFHATAKEALLVFGVNPDAAIAFATVLHVFGFLPAAVLGLISMIREGLSFAGVQQAASHQAEAEVAPLTPATPISPEPSTEAAPFTPTVPATKPAPRRLGN